MGTPSKWLQFRGEGLLVVLATGLFAAGLCFITPALLQGSDYVVLWRPSFRFLADAIREGRVPFWNPYMHLGRPYLADMSNMAFYPPTYLICLGEQTGFFLQVWLHCLIAVFGMRKLCEALRVGRWQSCFMAFTFIASGALTARWVTGQLPNCWSICYVPLLFYFAARTEEPWQSRRMALYAVFLALQLLCHPQVFWFSAIGQAVFIFTRAMRVPVREALRDTWHGLWQFAAACVWCAGLLAVVLIPFLELVKESNRSQNSPAFANSFNLSWSDLGYLFGPLRSGAGWEGNLFVGAIVVMIGILGLCLVRERNVRGLLGVLAVGLLLALGDKTPFFGLFYKWLPGYADFRFQSRVALLAVFVLICAAGIWLSRPHPRLRVWWASIFGVPVCYLVIGLVLLQSLDLLWGTWEAKRIITVGAKRTLVTPPDHSFEETLVAKLRAAGLMAPLRQPPRVCVPPSLVPANYGMIYRYSNIDADWPLFLRRPWDYLHAMLRIPPPEDKGELSAQVYNHGPFPYPDLGLSVGSDVRTWDFVVATNPAPRAFLVHAAEVADYGTILKRLAGGFDIHRGALIEKPLAEPLPLQSNLPGTPAFIRRFEPNSLLVDVDAKEKALLVLAEGWYPGWRAEIDGRVCECVPANIWMRAVPVPAGRHEVKVYFHQNHLAAGLFISLASAGLVLIVLSRSRRQVPPGTVGTSCRESDQLGTSGRGLPPGEVEPTASNEPARPSRDENTCLKPDSDPAAHPRSLPVYGKVLCTLTAGALFACFVATTGSHRVRVYRTMKTNVDASFDYWWAMTLNMHHQPAQAIVLYKEVLRLTPSNYLVLNDLALIRASNAHAEFRDGPEAVRLAQRACELSNYRLAGIVGTLGAAYAEAGRFDEAVAAAELARQMALAEGQIALAAMNLELIKLYTARQPYHEAQ